MKLNLSQNIIVLVLLGIASIGFISCSDSGANSKKADTSSKDENYRLVEVKTLTAESFIDYISLVGVVKPFQEAKLSSIEGGKISKIVKDKGSYVKEGDLILTMDNDILKANLDAAKAQYDLAEINFQKQEQIYKDNVSSELSYLQTKYQRDAAKANYELNKARYDKSFIKAPFAGYVDNKFFEEGEVVPPGFSIVSLINTDRVKISAGLPENYISDIKLGNECSLRFKDLNNLEIKARISFISKSIITDNRTLPIEMVVSNYKNSIKPELNVEVRIQRGKYDKMIVVPENVITRTDFGYIAFVANGDKAEIRKVKILNRINNQIAISEGLKDGDKLIVTGYQSLVNGEHIKIMQ